MYVHNTKDVVMTQYQNTTSKHNIKTQHHNILL